MNLRTQLGSDVSREKLQTSCRKIAKEVVGVREGKGAGTVPITAVWSSDISDR